MAAATTTECWESVRSQTGAAAAASIAEPGTVYVTLHRRSMHVLLLRPVPGNERFGLGPFFRIEPLGMEYIAAALEARGHRVDARGSPLQPLARASAARTRVPASSASPRCTRSRPTTSSRWRAASARSRRACRSSSAATPPPPIPSRSCADVDAVVLDDGERALPRIADALERGRPLRDVPGLALRERSRRDRRTTGEPGDASRSTTCRCRRGITSRAGGGSTPAWRIARPGWSRPRAAVRSAARSARSGSCTRARCASGRSSRSAGTSRRSATTSSSPTICSGTTRRAASRWRRSCAAAASASAGFSCRAASISSRGTPDLLEAWRPLAQDFDIFFGLEAATNEGLDRPDEGRDRRSDGSRASRSRARSATASPATS